MGNKRENIRSKKDVLAMTEIKSAGDIYQILNCVRINGRKDDKVAEKLVCLLIRQETWEHGHGMELYELILRQYSSEEMLDQLLTVSGQSDGYRNLRTPAERRKKYADNHPEIQIDYGAMDKAEKEELHNISEDVYHDFVDNHSRLCSLYEKWISQTGLDPKILETSNISERQKKAGPQKTQTKIQTTVSERRKTNDAKNDKKGSRKKSRIFVNIITPIKISYTKVAVEKPQYGFGILLFVLAFLLFVFFMPFLKTPKIEDISVIYPRLELMAGERKDPGIGVSPTEADKDGLGYTIEDSKIADMTRDWKVVGGDGWREGTDNTTTITLSGGNAEKVEIFITLNPGFTDKADKEVPADGGAGEQQ